MKTRISPDNPFGYSRMGFAWEKIPIDSTSHLDFGCGDGRVLNGIRKKNISRLVGIDASRDAIECGREKYPSLELIHATQSIPLPFDAGTFTSASALDVIEHISVDEQESLLWEFHRILAQDSVLIITVPRKHVFSFLDAGNLKFRFPRLHRWFYCLRHSKTEYHRRYVSNPDGMIGDISAKKRWHEHFSRRQLAKLLEGAGFEIVEFDGNALLTRPLRYFSGLLQWIRPVRRLMAFVFLWDARKFASMNLFCAARKRV